MHPKINYFKLNSNLDLDFEFSSNTFKKEDLSFNL